MADITFDDLIIKSNKCLSLLIRYLEENLLQSFCQSGLSRPLANDDRWLAVTLLKINIQPTHLKGCHQYPTSILLEPNVDLVDIHQQKTAEEMWNTHRQYTVGQAT